MTDAQLDLLARRVLLDALRREEAELPDPPPFQPSLRHQRRMRAFLRNPQRWVRRLEHPAWKRTLHRAAAGFLLLLLAPTAFFFFTNETGAVLDRWVAQPDDDRILYRFEGKRPEMEEDYRCYGIRRLPDGYEEVKRTCYPSAVNVVYRKGDREEDVIHLDYLLLNGAVASSFKTDRAVVYDIRVNRSPGKLLSAINEGEMSVVTWIDEKKQIEFIIHADLDDETLLKMARSVKAVSVTDMDVVS